MNIWIVAVLGTIFGYISKVYNFLIFEVRLEREFSIDLYKRLEEIKHKKHQFQTTFLILDEDEEESPKSESTLHWYKIPFYIKYEERLLKSGYSGTGVEIVPTITTLFFLKKKLLKLLKQINVEKRERTISEVKLWKNNYWYGTINKLKEKVSDIILPESSEKNLEQIINDFISGKRKKAGILLYGKPGNGKTSIVKNIAIKYNLNIYIPSFNKETTNNSIVEMFLKVKKSQKSIMLFEDFDSVFKGRKALIEESGFSLDAILNCIDGVLINTDNKLFIFTTNTLEDVDTAIKNRPSRCDLIINVDSPNYEQRVKILQNYGLNGTSEKIASLTEGESAAVICEIAKRKLSEDESLMELEINTIIQSFK